MRTTRWRRWLPALLALALVGAGAPLANAAPVHPDVVNGRAPQPGDTRALVSIAAGGFSCGCTLVDPLHVITAAHCSVDSSGRPLSPSSVRVGWSTTTTRATPSLAVRTVSVHPGYDRTTFSNDLAVLELTAPIPGATPMLVAGGARSALALTDGASVRSAGFGRTSVNGPLSSTALIADLVVIPDRVCGSTKIAYRIGGIDFYGYGKDVDTALDVCAIGVVPGTTLIIDTCQGDSGGPLYSGTGINARLVGVVSVGDGCAGFNDSGQEMDTKVPGVYARTAPALGWLASVGVDMSDTSLAAPVIASATASGLDIDVTVAPGSSTRLDTVTVTGANTVSADDSATCTGVMTAATATCRLTGLTAGATYSLSAIAAVGDLMSPPSATVTVTLPGRPGAPVIRGGVFAGASRVRLTVTPGADNGSPVTSTTVTCTARGPAKAEVPRATGTVVDRSVTLTLVMGYRYTCRAVSANAFGATRSRPYTFAF